MSFAADEFPMNHDAAHQLKSFGQGVIPLRLVIKMFELNALAEPSALAWPQCNLVHRKSTFNAKADHREIKPFRSACVQGESEDGN